MTEAVWTLIELCLTRASVDIEARSEPEGVQDSRLYDGASPGTTHSSWCCSALVADARRDRRDDAQLGQRQGQGVEKLCLVPVKQVERETGLNFLSNVSPQVQQVIESKVDSQ